MLRLSPQFLNLSTNTTPLPQNIPGEVKKIEMAITKIINGETTLSPKVSLLFLYKRLCNYYKSHCPNLERLSHYNKAYESLLRQAKPGSLEHAEAHSNAGIINKFRDEMPFQTALSIYRTLEAREDKTHSSGGIGEIQCGKIYVLFSLCLTALIKNEKQTAFQWINEAIRAHQLFLSEKRSNPDLPHLDDLMYTKQEITMQILLDNYEKTCTKENDFEGDPQKLDDVINEFQQLTLNHQEEIKQKITVKSLGYSSSTEQKLSRFINILKGGALLPIVGIAEMVTEVNIIGPAGKAIVFFSGALAGYLFARSKEAYQLLTEQRRKPFLILRRRLNIEDPVLLQCLNKETKPQKEEETPTLRRRKIASYG